MVDLDDAAALAAADPARMLEAVAALPGDCRDGYELGASATGLPSAAGVTAVAFCGMGGSGISGDVLRALYRDRLGVPLDVVRGPELPEFCGPHTLVICSSYSGNTAETLSCFDEAVRRGCRVVALTSGGALGRRCEELGIRAVGVPQGSIAPRAAFGFLAFGSIGALEAMGIAPSSRGDVDDVVRLLERAAAELSPDVPRERNRAKQLAEWIGERVPVIWGAEGIGAVAAARWKTQLNENAKTPAFSSVLPELDHNEVVGWSAGAGERFCLIALRHDGEHPDVRARFPVSIDIAVESGIVAEEVAASGRSRLSQLLSLVMPGDFTSVYLALSRGVDPTPVEAIDRLKRALAGP